MTALVTDNLPLLSSAPNGIKKLRNLILELAVTGRLVEQNTADEPVERLIARISVLKEAEIAAGRLKRQKVSEVAPDAPEHRIPTTWRFVQLGDVVEIVRGITFPASEKSKEPGPGKIACLRTANVQDEIEWDDLLYVRESFVGREDQYLQPRDIVMSMANSRELVGKVALVAEHLSQRSTFGGFLGVLRPYFVEPRYVMALLRTPRARAALIDSASQTTNIANVSLGKLRPLPIALPPIEEQHRIIAKVDELMALCDRLEAEQADAEAAHAKLVEALLASLTQARDAADFRASWQQLAEHFHTLFTTEASVDALKQTVMQLGVRGKLAPQRAGDESATDLLNGLGIEALAHELPGWASVTLGSLGTVLGGATPSKANAAYWTGDIPWVSPKDMKRAFIADTEDHVSPEAIAGSGLKLIPEGSILMVVRGMILAHSFPVALTEKPVTINQDMKALVPPAELARYLLLVLQASKHDMVGLVDRSSHGTCKLVSEKLWSTAVALPPLAEQRRIVAKVDELLGLCEQLKLNLTQAGQHHECLASVLVEQAVA